MSLVVEVVDSINILGESIRKFHISEESDGYSTNMIGIIVIRDNRDTHDCRHIPSGFVHMKQLSNLKDPETEGTYHQQVFNTLPDHYGATSKQDFLIMGFAINNNGSALKLNSRTFNVRLNHQLRLDSLDRSTRHRTIELFTPILYTILKRYKYDTDDNPRGFDLHVSHIPLGILKPYASDYLTPDIIEFHTKEMVFTDTNHFLLWCREYYSRQSASDDTLVTWFQMPDLSRDTLHEWQYDMPLRSAEPKGIHQLPER